MKVKDVMTSPAVTVGPDTPFKEIVETLAAHRIGGLPVVDGEGTLLGLVTEADLLAKEAYGGSTRRRRLIGLVADVLAGTDMTLLQKAGGLVARDVMTERVVTADPAEDVRRVARRMLENGVKRLPVVTAGRVVGVVARVDLLRVFDRSDDSMEVILERLLQRCMFLPPDDEIDVTVADGVATLTGTVRFQGTVGIVEAIVRAADGVVGVENHLVFREPDHR